MIGCPVCKSKSFRYSKKDKNSYCLTCGFTLNEKEFRTMCKIDLKSNNTLKTKTD